MSNELSMEHYGQAAVLKLIMQTMLCGRPRKRMSEERNGRQVVQQAVQEVELEGAVVAVMWWRLPRQKRLPRNDHPPALTHHLSFR
jgi:hypothetical protein